MANQETRTTATANREILLTRRVDAPRDLVWRAFTEPEHLAQWWGPKGFTCTFHECDVRPGGRWRFIMHGPDGVDYDNNATFEELVKPHRIVLRYTDEKDGSDLHTTTITLAEDGDGTQVSLHMLLPTAEARDFVVKNVGAIERGYETLDRLAGHLAGMK